MGDKSIVGKKSKLFAIGAIDLYRSILIPQNEYILSKQFLRSATSIGANIAEATGAYSKKEFSNKMSIAYKEARETSYWLEILHESGYVEHKKFGELYYQLTEINKLLFSILRTTHIK